MADEEKSRELTRSNFAAQMAMLGYEPNGNPKDMVEVVRCKDCVYYKNFGDEKSVMVLENGTGEFRKIGFVLTEKGGETG